MSSVATVGAVVLLLGLVGYAAGIATAYPGRAFSVTGVMVGIGLAALGRAGQEVAE